MPADCPTASGLDFPDSPRFLSIDGFCEGLVSLSQARLPARRRIAPRPVYRPLYVCPFGGAWVRQRVSFGAFHQISVLHTAKREDFGGLFQGITYFIGFGAAHGKKGVLRRV
jgi:hypothetical protein